MIKTIKHDQVTSVAAGDVVPGMILAEGIVLQARRQGEAFFYDLPSNHVVYADVYQAVQVYARVNDVILGALKEAHLSSVS